MCKHAIPVTNIIMKLHYIRMGGICTELDKSIFGIKPISKAKSLIYGNILHMRWHWRPERKGEAIQYTMLTCLLFRKINIDRPLLYAVYDRIKWVTMITMRNG